MIDIQPHQQRVVAEFNDLVDKAAKLEEFMDSPRFSALPKAESDLLTIQLQAMADYGAALGGRLYLWGIWP